MRSNTKIKYILLLLLTLIETGLLGNFLYTIDTIVFLEFTELNKRVHLSLWIFLIFPILMFCYMKSIIFEMDDIKHLGLRSRLMCLGIIVAEILGTIMMYPLAQGIFYRDGVFASGVIYTILVMSIVEFILLIFNIIAVIKVWKDYQPDRT